MNMIYFDFALTTRAVSPLETLLQHVNSNYGIKTVIRISPLSFCLYFTKMP